MATLSGTLILLLLAPLTVSSNLLNRHKRIGDYTDEVVICSKVIELQTEGNQSFKGIISCSIRCKDQTITQVGLSNPNNLPYIVKGGLNQKYITYEFSNESGLPMKVSLSVYASRSRTKECNISGDFSSGIQLL